MSESTPTAALEGPTRHTSLDHREVIETTGNPENIDASEDLESSSKIIESTSGFESPLEEDESTLQDALEDLEWKEGTFDDDSVGFERVEKHLRLDERRVFDRLKSIEEDAVFVSDLAQHMFPGYPLVANERCGPWYFHPEKVICTMCLCLILVDKKKKRKKDSTGCFFCFLVCG